MDNRFEKDDRVVMLRYDGWANKGWTGIVKEVDGKSIYVKWDKTYRCLWHVNRNLKRIDGDPNTAFALYKQKQIRSAKKGEILKKTTLWVPTTFEFF
jgi:hypothetical protein